MRFEVKKDRRQGYLYVRAIGAHMPETCFGLSYPGALYAARVMLGVAHRAQGKVPDNDAAYLLATHLLELPPEGHVEV